MERRSAYADGGRLGSLRSLCLSVCLFGLATAANGEKNSASRQGLSSLRSGPGGAAPEPADTPSDAIGFQVPAFTCDLLRRQSSTLPLPSVRCASPPNLLLAACRDARVVRWGGEGVVCVRACTALLRGAGFARVQLPRDVNLTRRRLFLVFSSFVRPFFRVDDLP